MKNNFKVISQREFETMNDADKFLFGEHHDKFFDYELRDKKTNEIVDEGYIESADEIVESADEIVESADEIVESADEIVEIAMENMFPDEESMEGFDWTFE